MKNANLLSQIKDVLGELDALEAESATEGEGEGEATGYEAEERPRPKARPKPRPKVKASPPAPAPARPTPAPVAGREAGPRRKGPAIKGAVAASPFEDFPARVSKKAADWWLASHEAGRRRWRWRNEEIGDTWTVELNGNGQFEIVVRDDLDRLVGGRAYETQADLNHYIRR